MRYILGRPGLAALRRTMRADPLLAFDFDGTLAPIVARPDLAMVEPAVAQRLALLAKQHPVAIVTGRAVSDVANRLGFSPQFIVGNHGAENENVSAQVDFAALEGIRTHLAAHAAHLHAHGVRLEDKDLSLALHYRDAPDPRRAKALIGKLLRNLDPALECFGGKRVFNVVVRAAPDKADAIESILQRTSRTCAAFVGDDVGDELAFARAPTSWLTVRVGREDMQSRARYYLRGNEEILALIDHMIDAAGST